MCRSTLDFTNKPKEAAYRAACQGLVCVLGSVCTRMAANVLVLDLVNAASNFVK